MLPRDWTPLPSRWMPERKITLPDRRIKDCYMVPETAVLLPAVPSRPEQNLHHTEEICRKISGVLALIGPQKEDNRTDVDSDSEKARLDEAAFSRELVITKLRDTPIDQGWVVRVAKLFQLLQREAAKIFCDGDDAFVKEGPLPGESAEDFNKWRNFFRGAMRDKLNDDIDHFAYKLGLTEFVPGQSARRTLKKIAYTLKEVSANDLEFIRDYMGLQKKPLKAFGEYSARMRNAVRMNDLLKFRRLQASRHRSHPLPFASGDNWIDELVAGLTVQGREPEKREDPFSKGMNQRKRKAEGLEAAEAANKRTKLG